MQVEFKDRERKQYGLLDVGECFMLLNDNNDDTIYMVTDNFRDAIDNHVNAISLNNNAGFSTNISLDKEVVVLSNIKLVVGGL